MNKLPFVKAEPAEWYLNIFPEITSLSSRELSSNLGEPFRTLIGINDTESGVTMENGVHDPLTLRI